MAHLKERCDHTMSFNKIAMFYVDLNLISLSTVPKLMPQSCGVFIRASLSSVQSAECL